ncbi:hypothetical protein DIPPA_08185 [Diplonema papillatum]|nr:hypothetical protein DIPPA_08185 [Diplonema papillatum]
MAYGAFPKRVVKTVRGKVDGDGLVTDIYNLVWSHAKTGQGITIPETVILEQGFPRAWYSSGRDVFEMEKKLGKEIVLSKVFSQWVNGLPRLAVVAEFASQRTEAETGESVLTFEYFDAEGLHKFLQTRAHGVSGLLQRFVEPKGGYNVVLQATWSPHAMLCSSRRNNNLLSNTSAAPADRCCTFDGMPSLSTAAPVSRFVRDKIGKELAAFAKRVEEHQKALITGLVCFLKFDDYGQLHFLKCTSIRTARDAEPALVVPLNLAVRFDAVTRRDPSDTVVFRYDRQIPKRPRGTLGQQPSDGDADEDDYRLPEIDLTNITDSALDVLAMDTSDMLYLPSSRKHRRLRKVGKANHSDANDVAVSVTVSHAAGAANGGWTEAQATERKLSFGLPDIAKAYPVEYSILRSYLHDVLYNCHWHFFGEAVGNASHNFQQARTADREPPKPFDFVVPEQIIAIIGYNGVDALMERYGAAEDDEKYEANAAPPEAATAAAAAGGGTDQPKAPEVSHKMYLQIAAPHPSLLELDSVDTFTCERLQAGFPVYQGGIDWARIRETRGARRSTHWLKMVGASEAAFKMRDEAEKKRVKYRSEESTAFAEMMGQHASPPADDEKAGTTPAARPSAAPAAKPSSQRNLPFLGDLRASDHGQASRAGSLVESINTDPDEARTPGLSAFRDTLDNDRDLFVKFRFLRKGEVGHPGGAGRRIGDWKVGSWKLNATFPEPPSVPRSDASPRKASPPRGAKRSLPHPRKITAVRCRQEQLEFWCQ